MGSRVVALIYLTYGRDGGGLCIGHADRGVLEPARSGLEHTGCVAKHWRCAAARDQCIKDRSPLSVKR